MPRTNSANPIWEFFDENREQKLAKCKICSGFYSYSSTTNNLKAHLKRKHGFDDNDFTKDFEYVLAQLPNAETDTGNTESSFIPKKRKNASFLWTVFKKVERFTAKCRLCDQNVRFKGTTGNLSVHLKRYHQDAVEKIKEAASGNDEQFDRPDFASRFLKRHKDAISVKNCQNIKKNRDRVSPEVIKEYFQELEKSLTDVDPINIVNYDESNVETDDDPGGKKVIVERGTTSEEEEENSLHQQDIYFEEEDDQVKCTVCGKVISEDGEDPRGHLEEHHPALLARIIKDEDRAEEEAEKEEEESQNETDIFTEVVYLDEVTSPQTPKRHTQTKKLTTDSGKKRKLSTNSDDYLIKSKKTKEIESFTNYIRILLEKLPQDVCSRLQLEIINLIMAAQFNLPSNSSSAAAASTSVTVDNN